MALKLHYKTIDVFTATRFRGNPLAIVHIPANAEVTHDQKLSVAREFNLSETVFLHEPDSQSKITEELSVKIDIYITTGEIPFAGHPTVGTGWYLLSGISGISTSSVNRATLRCKAGQIPVTRGTASKVLLSVPIDLKIHTDFDSKLKHAQPLLKASDYVRGLEEAEPIVSIVKGMTFMLLQLASRDALSRLRPFPQQLALPDGYLGEWAGYTSIYAFFVESDDESGTKLHTRMFNAELGLEDPATGSAASALTGYLAAVAVPSASETKRFTVIQGVDMGRKSDIGVTVTLNNGEIKGIELEGEAVEVSEGSIWV